jgi:hypothetical protein
MKDIVSMRKIRFEPFESPETGPGPGMGATLAGDDFFLAGN